MLGFSLVPGIDPQGKPWRMSFLHAFYFVSFLGTTIGLGEIPYPFSDTRRLWATASIYGTVLAWLHAIGAMFSALQDPMFKRLAQEGGVERQVRHLHEPFYLLWPRRRWLPHGGGQRRPHHQPARHLCRPRVSISVLIC